MKRKTKPGIKPKRKVKISVKSIEAKPEAAPIITARNRPIKKIDWARFVNKEKYTPDCIQLTQKTAQEIKQELYLLQDGYCPIIKQRIKWGDSTLDHQHKLKSELSGPEGKGLIRGVLHFQANSFEGKVYKTYKRYGLHKFIDLVSLLRNLADYLECPPATKLPSKYIHPNEKEKAEVLGKRKYKKILKWHKKKYPKRALPGYPHKGKIGKTWQQIIAEYFMDEKE